MTPATLPAPLAALLQTRWAEPVGSRSSLQGRLMGDVACRKAEPPALWTFWCLLVSRWWLSQDPTQVNPPPPQAFMWCLLQLSISCSRQAFSVSSALILVCLLLWRAFACLHLCLPDVCPCVQLFYVGYCTSEPQTKLLPEEGKDQLHQKQRLGIARG